MMPATGAWARRGVGRRADAVLVHADAFRLQ